MSRLKTIPPGPYSPNVTQLDQGFFGDRRSTEEAEAYAKLRRGDPSGMEAVQLHRKVTVGTRSAPVRFRLVTNVPLLIFNGNPRRTGLLIQNRDAVTGLFIAFGHVADTEDFSLAALGIMLLDFTCPTDNVWVLATAAISGIAYEFS